jgi:deoxycytidylate deaminase
MSLAGKSDQPVACRKREGYIKWDDYFMAVAFLSAQRSKDPKLAGSHVWLYVCCSQSKFDSTQVGACIVNEANKIVGIGGFAGAHVSYASNCVLLAKVTTVCHWGVTTTSHGGNLFA